MSGNKVSALPHVKYARSAGAPAGPSIISLNGILPPPPKEEEVLLDIAEVISDRAKRLKLIRLIEEEEPWKKQEAEAKKARKPLVNAMKKILGEFQVSKCGWDGRVINYFLQERKSIKRDKLIIALTSAGMQPTQIAAILAAATEESVVYTLRIKEAGEEEDANSD